MADFRLFYFFFSMACCSCPFGCGSRFPGHLIFYPLKLKTALSASLRINIAVLHMATSQMTSGDLR